MVYILDRDLHRGRADANWRDRTVDVRRVQIGVVRDGQQVVWDTQRPGHVWCRVLTGDAATGEKSYFCKVAPVFGAYAYVDRDVDGILKLLRTDDRANVEVFGARAVTLSTPPPDLSTRTSAAYDRVAAHRLDILRARPTVPASLRLQYSGGMVAHNGAHYWVPRGLTDDLTIHVPGSGKRLCVIGLDMPGKTLVYADGPTVALSTPLTEADAAAVTLTGSGTVIPLWAVTLRAGQSTVVETDILTIQPWLTTPTGSGGGGAAALDDLTDVDTDGVSDGDVLTYDAGTSTWIAAAPAGGGGGGGTVAGVLRATFEATTRTEGLDYTSTTGSSYERLVTNIDLHKPVDLVALYVDIGAAGDYYIKIYEGSGTGSVDGVPTGDLLLTFGPETVGARTADVEFSDGGTHRLLPGRYAVSLERASGTAQFDRNTSVPAYFTFYTNSGLASGSASSVPFRIEAYVGAYELVDVAASTPVDGLPLAEQASDPEDPEEGRAVLWLSDGTGSGDDGDLMVKITAGGVTKTVTLVDFSAV